MKHILFIVILFIGLNFTSFAQTNFSHPVENTQSKLIKCYPNPAGAVVNFEFQNGYSRFYSLRVLNSLGKQVYEQQNIPSLLTLNLKEEKFYRGIYIYQLLDHNGVVIESEKILVIN